MLRTKLQKNIDCSNSSMLFYLNFSFLDYHFGVMPMNISKLMPGMGRDSTDKYSSLKRLFIVPFSDSSAHLNTNTFSSEMFDMKYGGSLPVSDMSFDDMV